MKGDFQALEFKMAESEDNPGQEDEEVARILDSKLAENTTLSSLQQIFRRIPLAPGL